MKLTYRIGSVFVSPDHPDDAVLARLDRTEQRMSKPPLKDLSIDISEHLQLWQPVRVLIPRETATCRMASTISSLA